MAHCCPLPLYVVITILVRLSVMPLLRLRSVCKSWRALIDSSNFVNQHLLHQDVNTNDGLIAKDLQHQNWTLLSGHQFDVRANIYPKTHFSSDRLPWSLMDSSNGIVCLYTSGTSERLCVALWNPATRQLACLPEPPLVPASKLTCYCSTILGFGYAVKADDYKVIRVVDFMIPDLPSVLHREVEIYDLSTNCWRNIDINFPSGPFFSTSKLYFNGRYFWDLINPSQSSASILSFDFSNEVFEIMLLPDVLSNKSRFLLTTIGDSIAHIDHKFKYHQQQDELFDIWVMTKYGVKDSWTKLHTVRLIVPLTLVTPVGLAKNGEILLLSHQTDAGFADAGFELACSDLKTQQIKNLSLSPWEHAVYKESLVSIRKAMPPANFPIVRDTTVRANNSLIELLTRPGLEFQQHYLFSPNK